MSDTNNRTRPTRRGKRKRKDEKALRSKEEQEMRTQSVAMNEWSSVGKEEEERRDIAKVRKVKKGNTTRSERRKNPNLQLWGKKKMGSWMMNYQNEML